MNDPRPSPTSTPGSDQHDVVCRDGAAPAGAPRRWRTAAGLALAVVVAMVLVSAFANPLLGRVVHWRRIELGAPAATLVFALTFRRRWL